MCHALTPSPGGKGVLVRAGGSFHSRAELFGNRSRYQSSHHVTSHNAAHTTVGLRQCRDPPQSQEIHNPLWNLRTCQPLGHAEEQVQGPHVVQQRAQVLSGVSWGVAASVQDLSEH